jgi:hypothetical protein
MSGTPNTVEQSSAGVNSETGISKVKVLGGDRFRCMMCGDYFNSTYAFDQHRRGEYGRITVRGRKTRLEGNTRRCLTVMDMQSAGWNNRDGYWYTPIRGIGAGTAHSIVK